VAPTGTVSGYWHHGERRVPIYAGVGDHQCSVLGACNTPRETISLNLGTGSQVAMIDAELIRDEFELRPYFDGRFLPAITRIPAGRALAQFLGFLDQAAGASSGGTNFWALFNELDEDALRAASLDFDLAIFGSAWRYHGGGHIAGILDGSLTLQNYLASLMKSWVRQYVEAIALFDPERRAARCVLSGGLARRLPLLHRILAHLTGYETWPACMIDESLLGLRTVALVAAQRAESCLAAQAIFGRECTVHSDTNEQLGREGRQTT
jgi:sugar (pentulose or hexulose) kinase